MEWQVLLALIVSITLCFLPVIMAWQHYFGHRAHTVEKSKTEDLKKVTVKPAGAGVQTNSLKPGL